MYIVRYVKRPAQWCFSSLSLTITSLLDIDKLVAYMYIEVMPIYRLISLVPTKRSYTKHLIVAEWNS